MPKLEKDRPMPAVREIKTLWGDLAKTMKEQDIDPNVEVTICISEEEPQANKVTFEQQKLLDKFMNVVRTKGKGNKTTTEIIREERQARDGNDSDGFPLNNKDK